MNAAIWPLELDVDPALSGPTAMERLTAVLDHHRDGFRDPDPAPSASSGTDCDEGAPRLDRILQVRLNPLQLLVRDIVELGTSDGQRSHRPRLTGQASGDPR